MPAGRSEPKASPRMEFDIGAARGARMRQNFSSMSRPTTRPLGPTRSLISSVMPRGAAADIETAPARRDADALEHRQRIRRHRLALDAQPLDLAGAMLERIVAGEGL